MGRPRGGGESGQCWSCAAIGGLVGALGAVLLIGIILASGWWAGRGVQVRDVACAWDEAAGIYRASLTARNAEPQFKVVSIWVQARFAPGPGGRWPTPALRHRYEQVSDQAAFELPAFGEAAGEVAFAIPGLRDYRCEAEARLGRQERFEARPSDETLSAVVGEMRGGSGRMARGPAPRRRGL